MKPLFGITMGDPAGIGPELLLKTFSNWRINPSDRYVVFGDFSYLQKSFSYFKRKIPGLQFPFLRVPSSEWKNKRFEVFKGGIPVVDSGMLKPEKLTFGLSKPAFGWASGVFIQQAIEAALAGRLTAIVTLPIHKKSFAMGGWGGRYRDHTQMLAALTHSKRVALLLVNGPLRAVHVTQHIPLAEVASRITRMRVQDTIRLAHEGMRKLGIRRPRIAVCGLNPHAGDDGVIGREEIRVIRPAVRLFQKKGWRIDGPLSADAVWPRVARGQYDVGVAMYHDQGQIPVKFHGDKVVNITLGLPFVRTSVGHGTAYDIAGEGKARVDSFLEAIRMARAMNRAKT